jgi:hypothetical protein
LASPQLIVFGMGTLLSPLQLVYLSLQTLQFQPFGLGWVS